MPDDSVLDMRAGPGLRHPGPVSRGQQFRSVNLAEFQPQI
jgi:hypothetical protein